VCVCVCGSVQECMNACVIISENLLVPLPGVCVSENDRAREPSPHVHRALFISHSNAHSIRVCTSGVSRCWAEYILRTLRESISFAASSYNSPP